ncbi:MAG: M48 family metallopeptidase, partial [Candidatus Cloacimonetes bacterium]|nr:M48 family metallopeptidase [Candidatus Cloacimonadota bacterium]
MKTAQSRQYNQAAINYTKLRYKAEEEIERVLEEDFSMAQYYDIFDNKDDLDAITNEMLSNNVLLSPAIAPRIYSICSEIQQKLGFAEQIDFYLQSHTEVNAFSINGFGIVPHIISFTSALIQLMTDDELRYVIGHEIGHLIYKHSKLNIVHRFLNKREDERLPAMITLHYLRYINYAEISADRIGYIAMPDINVVTNTFFKLTCGLSEQHLNFNAPEYLKQLDRIKEIGTGDLYSSHPNPMIRIQALMDFAASELSSFGMDASLTAAELDERVDELMRLLEKHPKKQKDLMIVRFLATLGMYLATYDEDSFQQKYNQLYD